LAASGVPLPQDDLSSLELTILANLKLTSDEKRLADLTGVGPQIIMEKLVSLAKGGYITEQRTLTEKGFDRVRLLEKEGRLRKKAPDGGTTIQKPKHTQLKIGIGIVVTVIVVLILVVGMGLIPLAGNSGTNQLPIWHTFDNVFGADCNPSNCASNSYAVSSDCGLDVNFLLTCHYEGTPYYGSFFDYCNTQPNGVIPSVNGTLVPYLGCVLSRAPITKLFSDLYSLSGQGSSISMVGYSGNNVTVFLTPNFRLNSCSYQYGYVSCDYLGIVYSGQTSNVCNLGTPIQVSGASVPAGACVLQRN